MNARFQKTLKSPITISLLIASGCVLMLLINRHNYKLARTPGTYQTFYDTEIDGYLNYLENDSPQTSFSIQEQPTGFFRGVIIPMDSNPGFRFYAHAAIHDVIHKASYSDTLVLIKNKVSYYYRMLPATN